MAIRLGEGVYGHVSTVYHRFGRSLKTPPKLHPNFRDGLLLKLAHLFRVCVKLGRQQRWALTVRIRLASTTKQIGTSSCQDLLVSLSPRREDAAARERS
jgi:hypothetical protein